MANTQSTRVTNAVLRNDLHHLTELVKRNFDQLQAEQVQIVAELKVVTGLVYENRETLAKQNSRLEHLERWKDGLIKSAVEWVAKGLAVGAGGGAVLYGIGKAAGWW
jgi:hypothetical protein